MEIKEVVAMCVHDRKRVKILDSKKVVKNRECVGDPFQKIHNYKICQRFQFQNE